MEWKSVGTRVSKSKCKKRESIFYYDVEQNNGSTMKSIDTGDSIVFIKMDETGVREFIEDETTIK